MKIGFLNILYSKPAERGGLGSHIVTLSRELARRGHDVTVLTSGTEAASVECGVRVVPLGPVERYHGARQLATPSYVFGRLAYMWRAAQFIQSAGFDVVEAADGGVEHLFLLWRRSCPIVMKLHGSFQGIYRPGFGIGPVMHGLESIALRRSDALYTSSQRYAADISRQYGIPSDHVGVIAYGIDLRAIDAQPRPRPSDRFPATAGKRLVLLSVGSSVERKGAPVFIEVARQWKDREVLFVLVCSNPAVVATLSPPDNVLVVGQLDKPDFYGLLAASDAVLFPSEFETFSIATHEAILLGRPVIVSRHVPLEGPAADYPRCVTLDRLDAMCLGSAVRHVLNEGCALPAVPHQAESSLRAAYSIESVAEQTLSFYHEVVDRYQRSAT
jgi:glycosyltransferase involved in cell wall biosynthesis